MTTAVLRTNIQMLQPVNLTVAFTNIVNPTTVDISVPGVVTTDMLVLTNNRVQDGSLYFWNAPFVPVDGTVRVTVWPNFDPTGGGFISVSSAGTWQLTVLRVGFPDGMATDSVPFL